MRLDLDSEVRFPDGKRAGHLRKIVLDENNDVTEVVVETAHFFSKMVIVPIKMLSEGPGGVTYVNYDRHEFDKLEEYIENQIPDPEAPTPWDFSESASAVGEVFPVSTYGKFIPVAESDNLPE